MKRRFFFVALIFASAMFLCPGASAQRMTPGRSSLSLYMNMGTEQQGKFLPCGGGLTWSKFGYRTFYSVGADVSMMPFRVVHEESDLVDRDGNIIAPGYTDEFDHIGMDITAGGGYYVRVLSPRSRVVIFSVGLNGYTGVRVCSQLKDYKAGYIDSSLSGDKAEKKAGTVGYVLNVVPEALLEAFPMRNVSFYASCRPRMTAVNTLKGNYDWFKLYLSLGAKYYF